MNSQLRFLPEFFTDVQDAVDWYEQQQAGLGVVFQAAVEATLHRVADFPSANPLADDTTRVAIVERFPFGVFDRMVSSELSVIGLLHLHRRPGTWKGRRSPASCDGRAHVSYAIARFPGVARGSNGKPRLLSQAREEYCEIRTTRRLESDR
ncbi:MAG: hypothetical protein SFV23_08265 [Planctomycetaceae bacterium]|nr:hypothetical protein [Planctomycetaceae bacterium]